MITIHDLLCIILLHGYYHYSIVYHLSHIIYMKGSHQPYNLYFYHIDTTRSLSFASALIILPSFASPFKIRSDTGSSIKR